MDDKTLADKVVALGVGDRRAVEFGRTTATGYWINGGVAIDADRFVRDPRVAMALMERCEAMTVDDYPTSWNVTVYAKQRGDATGDSLPRAIIEAAVKALEES